jgi:hypothetical protein
VRQLNFLKEIIEINDDGLEDVLQKSSTISHLFFKQQCTDAKSFLK